MELRRAEFGEPALEEYSQLFATCFPSALHLRAPYLRWLYRDNPAGKLVGFNAIVDGRIAAHYACVPASVKVGGVEKRALLSLNTATRPDLQGRGLFTRLAESTYSAAAAEGFDFVFGVANANSTPGFIRKLGFQLVAPLESRIGFGRLGPIDWPRALAESEFSRTWPIAELNWRLSNPSNPIRTCRFQHGVTGFAAKTGKLAVHAWSELPCTISSESRVLDGRFSRPRIFLGAFPDGTCRFKYARLPDRLRPSPLNFIARGTNGSLAPSPDKLLVSFLDFDAF